MAGARFHIDLQDGQARRALSLAVRRLGDPRPLYQHIGEGLLPRWRGRFDTQRDPEGRRWQELSPRYRKRKHRNQGKVLTLRGYLRGTLRWQASAGELLIGTNSKYGAIHQFGGEISMGARAQLVRFRTTAKGSLMSQAQRGEKFRNADRFRVFARKNSKRSVERTVTVQAHKIVMPRRAFLGVSREDSIYIIATTRDYLASSFGR